MMIIFRVYCVALLLTGCASQAEAANPLLGRWKVEARGPTDRSGRDGCAVFPEFDFDATSQTMYRAGDVYGPGSTMVTHVIYFVHGNNVWTSSTPGFAGAPMFTMLGPNEMKAPGADGCRYTRM